jgi:hypothetical protein
MADRPVPAIGFLRRLWLTLPTSWEKQGVPFLDRLAADDPAKYADLCSRIIPRDVALTVEQRFPSGMDERDLMILRAIRDAIPTIDPHP